MQRPFSRITDLVLVFSDCLQSLIPHMSKAGIEWADAKSYDDWDTITTALYGAIVGSAIAYTVEGESFSELAPYGMRMSDYSRVTFLFSKQFGSNKAFLMLETTASPFDTAVFVDLDAEGKPRRAVTRVPLRQTQFVALLQSSNGRQRELADVAVDELPK